MSLLDRTFRLYICSWLFFILSVPFAAVAQEETTSQLPQESRTESATEGARPEAKDRTIYIPFGKLRDVFEKEGRGVFLPYDQFQALWEAAHGRQAPAPELKSPVDAIVTSAFNEATIERDVVSVSATLTIELIKQGWIQIPLRLKEAAIQSATIDGEAARITADPNGGYQLLVEHAAKEPQTIELKLVYARAFDKSPGRNSVAFDAPQAPVNRWRIRIPQAGVKVNVQPMIAATEEVADEPSENASESKDETVLLAFVGAAPQVTIDWTPKSEGAMGMTALTAVQVQQEMSIVEGAIRNRVNVHYDISRAELSELSIEIPSDQKVVNVFDPNVRKWLVSDEGKFQRILVELFEPARSTQNLLIELEQFSEGEAKRTVKAPVVRVEEVGRQQGTLVVNVDPALRAEASKRAGLVQVDASDLPSTLAAQTWTFAYRYASLPYELEINVEKIQPRISVTQLVESYVEPEQWTVELLAAYNIEDAGVFQLEFEVPAGFEVLDVRGREASDSSAAVVDAFHRTGDNQERLIVNLARKAIGKVAIAVRMQQRLTDPNLLTPTGSTSTFSLAIPQAKQANLTRAEGTFLLFAPESLRLNPTTTTGLRPLSFSEAYQTLSSLRENRFPTTRPVLSFAYSDQDAVLEMMAERRKSYVTARQRQIVRLDSGVVRYETRIAYDILYSGVKSLRIDVPDELAAEIRNTSGGIRETLMNPQPSDVAEGYVAWSLSGETEMIGGQVVQLSWERKLEQLEIGKSIEVEVPHIKPIGTDRAWGQIVLTKTESLDVLPAGEPTGLRPIDPSVDVMPDAIVPDAALAFEFYDDWTLSLVATRYQLEEVKRTSIERGVVRVVVTRSDQLGVQAIYRVRSARQRLSVTLHAEAEFDSQPARINGQPVALERGESGELFIPLVGQDPNTPFSLELRYSSPGGFAQIAVPEFPEDPAVQKVYAAVYLPSELALVGSSGPWTEEFSWVRKGAFKWVPQAKMNDTKLVQWVQEGIGAAPPGPFQTDGTMYLFSALRPQPAPAGNLHLWALSDKWLAAAIMVPIALVGLLLLWSPLRIKIFALAFILAAIVASGLFVPTFAQQLWNVPLYAALTIVAIVWLAWYTIRGIEGLSWFRSTPATPHPLFVTAPASGTSTGTSTGTPASASEPSQSAERTPPAQPINPAQPSDRSDKEEGSQNG